MAAFQEIGGYLEFERFLGKPFHDDAIALNSGRACLEYIIELRGINKLFLPDWLCSSVSAACFKHGVNVETYQIGENMCPVYDFKLPEGGYLYLVDYYGLLRREDVEEAKRFSDGRLIVDEAHGFFRNPWDGVDTVYTCRKFFGVADGGYLYTKDGTVLDRELVRDESYDHMRFVLGRFERSAEEFFAESKANNARFADEPVKAMSAVTENILRAVDYNGVSARRDENYAFLHERLGAVNMLSEKLDTHGPEGAFMYPLLVHHAGDARAELAKSGIFIPILWPNVLIEKNAASVARCYSKNILPLPVDQRYGREEMQAIVDAFAMRGLPSNLDSISTILEHVE